MIQDGTVREGVPSTELLPVEHVDEHDVWPNTFVVHDVEEAPGMPQLPFVKKR
jgi:hypothetical protein